MNAAALALEDAASRAAAQREFTRPLVLEAGAGTGKTATLVARVVAWMLGPGWEKACATLTADARVPGEGIESSSIAARVLDRIAAITFTEAAAAEMEERIATALALLASGGLPTGCDGDALPSPEARRARSRALLAAFDRLRVSTIHAFCRRLLAAHPLEAGLHPRFEIDAEGDLAEEVLRDVLDEQLRTAYGTPGDPHALALAAAGIGPAGLAETCTRLLAAGVTAEALRADPFASAAARGLVAELTQTAAELAAAVGEESAARLAAGRGKSAAELVRAAARLATTAGSIEVHRDGWILLRSAALELEGHESKLGGWARGTLTQTEAAELGERSGRVLAAARALRERLRFVRRLDPEAYDHARLAVAPVLDDARARLTARGAVSFEALLSGARELLAHHPALLAAERRAFDQLLVDEFQDTDATQCELLRLLALAGPLEERPGLFLVGDPKQSIYAWRSADLAAYDHFLEQVVAAGGTVLRLVRNYRSLPSILDEVERVAGPLFVHERGVQPAFAPLVAHREEGASSPIGSGRASVEVWLSLLERDRGEETSSAAATRLEAQSIAADARRLHDELGVPWKEIALLLRTTGDLDDYARALQEAGVPYAVARDRSYFRRREILDAAALVRAVLDPADHLALVTVLRAPWVGVPDAALPRLWRRGLPGLATELGESDPILERIRTLAAEVARELEALAPEIPGLAELAGWERSLSAFFDVLARLRASFVCDPADVFVENLRTWTLAETTEAARFLGVFRLANLERFFRELAETLAEGGDVEAVLRFLRRAVATAREAPEGRPREAADDALQVMTIHKAKGLDFTHVYVAQLHKQPRARPAAARAERSGGDWEMVLFGLPSPGFWRIEERDARLRAAEQVRLLYVATTRAKDRLVLLGRPEEPASPATAGSFAQLLPLRRPAPPAPEELRARLRAAGATSEVDELGVRWRCPGLEPPLELEAPRRVEPTWPTAIELETEAAQLTERRTAALARQARPLRGAVSAEAHHRLEHLFEGEEDATAEPRDAGSRDVRQAVGTAVHRLFETFDLAGDAEAELALRRALLHDELERDLPAERVAEARERAEAIVDAFRAGPYWERWCALRPHVLARELPLLVPAPAGADGPLSFLAGTLDLLARDPETGELVVIDFKTDDVESERARAERAAAYEPQLATYCAAVKKALELATPPRGELWWLGSST